MKNKVIKAIIWILVIFGIIGAAAALSKGFTEIPEFLINETETIEHHGSQQSGENSEEQILEAQDVNNIVDYEITYYVKDKSSHSAGASSMAMRKLNDSDHIFYATEAVESGASKNKKFGIKAKFLLIDGSFRVLNCGITIKNDNVYSCSYSFPEYNYSNFHIVCFSFDGLEPDISSKFGNDYYVYETIETDFDSKIFVYSCNVPQYINQQIVISLKNNDYSQSKTSYHYTSGFAYLNFNQLENLSEIKLNLIITEFYSNNLTFNHNFDKTISLNSNFERITICYSNNEETLNYYDYDELITELNFKDGDFKCKLWICGHNPEDPLGPEVSILPGGIYNISLTRDLLQSYYNENDEYRLIDNEYGDESFWLLSVETTYDNERIDFWDNGSQCSYLCDTGSYLEISSAGVELSIDTGGGEWLIDGFIAPEEINWTLNIFIKIESITNGNNYSELFYSNMSNIDTLTREFYKVYFVDELDVGSKVLIGTGDEEFGGVLNISSGINSSNATDTTGGEIFELNYELFGALLEVDFLDKNTGEISFKISNSFPSSYLNMKDTNNDLRPYDIPEISSEPLVFKFKYQSLCIELEGFDENESWHTSTWLGYYKNLNHSVEFHGLSGEEGNLPPSNASSLYLLSDGNNEHEIINDTVDDSTFENNREYVINPNLNASNIGRLTQNGTLTWRKRDKNTLEILDEKTNLDSFEVVGNDNPKHIQCKKNGSNVVEGTLVNFDTYADADYYITIEFSSSYNKSGYYQYVVFNSILGYIE